jgi:outer membrane protein assembly factor BamB
MVGGRTLRFVASLLAGVAICLGAGADWPQFRGAQSNSALPADALGENVDGAEAIAWKVELPGRGPSSPIVVGNRVVLTASSGATQDRLHVLCYDAQSGAQLWQRQFWATGRTLTHPSSANAANTPASDGKLIFAQYSSNDVVALDLEGNLAWIRGLAYDYPAAGNDVGMSSSPVVVGNAVVTQVENQGDSFAIALDRQTGKTLWRIDRPKEANWSSPVVLRDSASGEPTAVLLQSPSGLTAHDPATGRELWSYEAKCEGIPSSVTSRGLVLLPADGVVALRPSPGKQAPDVLWKENSLKPGGASLVTHDGLLYLINRSGVLIVADAENGKSLSKQRLEGYYWGTPTLVGDRLICGGQDGGLIVTRVTDGGRKVEIVGRVPLGETLQSSPVVADHAVFIRSDKHLWKIVGRGAAPAAK